MVAYCFRASFCLFLAAHFLTSTNGSEWIQPNIGIKLRRAFKHKFNDNETALEKKAMAFYTDQKWQKAYDFFIETWKAYNQTEQISGLRHIIYLGKMLYHAQLAAWKLELFNEALGLCQWILSSNLKVSQQQILDLNGWVKYYKYRLAAKKLKIIETLPKWQQLKIAQDLTSASTYTHCKEEFIARRLKDLAEDPALTCKYSNRNNHPLLILSPVKEEIYSLDPPVVLMHDIMLKPEIIWLKQLVSLKMSAARLHSNDQNVEYEHRKADIAWVNDGAVKNLIRRIEAYTSLKADGGGSEHLQVCHYNIGGHYLPHLDALQDLTIADIGDRTATLLLYASRVIRGGATVFTELKLPIAPISGAGLFWYNLHPDETVDERTVHAACPVIQGEKWIANKWFRQRAQFHHRPCLHREKRHFSLADFAIDSDRL